LGARDVLELRGQRLPPVKREAHACHGPVRFHGLADRKEAQEVGTLAHLIVLARETAENASQNLRPPSANE